LFWNHSAAELQKEEGREPGFALHRRCISGVSHAVPRADAGDTEATEGLAGNRLRLNTRGYVHGSRRIMTQEQ
jgi:hypothetical protein